MTTVSTAQAGTAPKPAPPLLEVDDLVVHFEGRRRQQPIRAVDGVSLGIGRGETLGLIGESGSGKSTIGRAVLGLLRPKAGAVRFEGEDPWTQPGRRRRELRRRMQVVFQDPHEALDPRMTVEQSVAEPLLMTGVRRPERLRRAADLLERVGLGDAHRYRRPHELSGGQKQRVNIARALASDPDLIVCDESVSALDVSIQAEILNLLVDLQDERGLSYLFISHDISVVAHLSHRVTVLYLGMVMESGAVGAVVDRPAHPYTRALLAAQPRALPSYLRTERREVLRGDIPSPAAPPSGCRFRTRCPFARDRCAQEIPAVRELEPGRTVACHFAEQL
ncbi:ABC transporter ATP-binding protein [Pseudonocardia humida]|uniref:ABC transporter ATP-binding protein n=1 Tax=Pseudonocardia humida TaxID=2800819 RepID=A0ABT1A212_9PSEU|nr:oligopeptide/dipeptide ABC transporter ATP-binding protein [Pseudonocardia humida]MCO1657032.1 ABC transporter ATP-binding protein [Pseudonocardia humida]